MIVVHKELYNARNHLDSDATIIGTLPACHRHLCPFPFSYGTPNAWFTGASALVADMLRGFLGCPPIRLSDL